MHYTKEDRTCRLGRLSKCPSMAVGPFMPITVHTLREDVEHLEKINVEKTSTKPNSLCI